PRILRTAKADHSGRILRLRPEAQGPEEPRGRHCRVDLAVGGAVFDLHHVAPGQPAVELRRVAESLLRTLLVGAGHLGPGGEGLRSLRAEADVAASDVDG